MKEAFIRLSGLILERELEGKIENFDVDIDDKVSVYNKYFGLKSENTKFVSMDEGVSLSPVPFSSTSENPKIGFIALNPKYDPGEAALEKRKGGQTWQEHAEFYTGEEVYRYVIEDKKSKYYQKQIKFIYALLYPDADNISIDGIRKSTQLTEYEIFKKLTDKCPIMFGEFIPFHSQNFNLSEGKVAKMMERLSGYERYFEGLLTHMIEVIPSNGLIVVDGKAPTYAFENFKGEEMTLIHKAFRTKDQKLLYDIYKWRERYILLARSVICGSGTDLSGLDVVMRLTEDVRKHTVFSL